MHRQQQLKQVVSSLLKTWPSSPKQTEGPKSHNKCKKKRSFAPHSSLISPWAATASLKCKCSSVMLDRSSARNRPRSTLSQHSWTTSNTSLTQWLILWLHTSSWRLFCIRHRAVPSPSSRCSPMLATWKKLLLPNSKPSRLGCSKSCSNTVWSNNVGHRRIGHPRVLAVPDGPWTKAKSNSLWKINRRGRSSSSGWAVRRGFRRWIGRSQRRKCLFGAKLELRKSTRRWKGSSNRTEW